MLTQNKQDTEDRAIKEKKAYTRHTCHEPTFYSTKDGLYECVIKDRDKEGVQGIFIETGEDLNVGEVITVAISSPGEKKGKN